MLYQTNDYKRDYEYDSKLDPWRGEFAKDYGRVIHSPSFRRLQGKTQVFPSHESDFFRNRLTHSLEVSQIAEGIADRLNHTFFSQLPESDCIDKRVCATASLMHDLGHPPFGHNGERALDVAMHQHGGFEGNAQTLRIIARLEKKIRGENRSRKGLGLCYRTLASIVKYDNEIPRARRAGDDLVKGYYVNEARLVARIKSAVLSDTLFPTTKKFKTIECLIMDVADDIAYSTYDLEDSLKAGFLTPAAILTADERLVNRVAVKVGNALGYDFTAEQVIGVFVELFEPRSSMSTATNYLAQFEDLYRGFQSIANDQHYRTRLSSELVNRAINACEIIFDKDFPMLSSVILSPEARERVEVLKQFTFIATIYSSRVKLPEFRGYEVVKGIFSALAGPRGELLMPEDVREQYESKDGDLDRQMRTVCDFVAGMTDRYAMEFYGRLHSDTAQSMFKPL